MYLAFAVGDYTKSKKRSVNIHDKQWCVSVSCSCIIVITLFEGEKKKTVCKQ